MKKLLLVTLLSASIPLLTLAQSEGTTKLIAKTDSKKSAKPVRNGQKAKEEAIPIDDDPPVNLSAAALEIAKQVYVGDIPCELGAVVHIAPHKREGFFIVRSGIQRFRMQPVESRTGAIRLEDPRAGAMWLQLGNKSMLMSQKMGRRLADECMSPEQAARNETLKKNPTPGLLEPVAKTQAAPAAGTVPTALQTTGAPLRAASRSK